MRKIIICLVLSLLLFSSCTTDSEYLPSAGEYSLVCKIGEAEYKLDLLLNEDMSGKLTFSEDSALSDWYFTYSPEDKSIKYFTSLGDESEANNEYVKKIFELVLDDHENIADVLSESISGRDVSILKMSDGSTVYTDSQSGAPLRLVCGDMTVDIISRPSPLA